MNSDSKPLKRYVILLNKAPFILFIETKDFPIGSDNLKRILSNVNLSMKDVERSVIIEANTVMQKILYFTNELPDTIAYHIVDAFAAALPHGNYFSVQKFFTSADWQKEVKWQNIDIKPTPEHQFTITIDRHTHDLHLIYSNDLKSYNNPLDGTIELSSVNISVPFPKALLKDCVIDIHEIIKVMSMNRQPEVIAKSKYMSVMHTGINIFNWTNLKAIERDLIATIKSANITIEE